MVPQWLEAAMLECVSRHEDILAITAIAFDPTWNPGPTNGQHMQLCPNESATFHALKMEKI